MARIVPDIIPSTQDLTLVPPDMTVRDAARLMRENTIAAVMVVDGERLSGIMTERDITTRVVAQGRDPDTTAISAVMTPDPDTLSPEDTAASALRMMRQHNYRHLPVVENGRPVGMVSIRDLYAVVQAELEIDLAHRDAYIFGERYGAAS